jgi:hypothetical protein
LKGNGSWRARNGLEGGKRKLEVRKTEAGGGRKQEGG